MKRPIYLDYMATTPVDPRVAEVMSGYLTPEGHFGNPASRTHTYGWRAEEAVALARQQVADLVHADVRDIIWTSGATEAINLALQGAAHCYRRKGQHIVTCVTEHSAVLDTCSFLETQGFSVTRIPVQSDGLIDLDVFEQALRADTLLVSIMQVNNEIGVVQDIHALAERTRARGILLHMDAAQSAGKLPIDVRTLPIDLMSFSAHKVYGPKGVGALWVSGHPKVQLQPLCYGGQHERGLRSGTLPTHQIAGMGEAFRIAAECVEEEALRIQALRDQLWAGISALPGVHCNGSLTERVAGNLNVCFEGVDGEALLMSLHDLAVSSGSACNSATIEPSHVLSALGITDHLAHSAIRFSLGRWTTEADIQHAIAHIHEQVHALRAASPLWAFNKA